MFGMNKEHKEAVGLVSIGTFLEYFDLMLYVHMAVILNKLFFPETGPDTATLLAAIVFCTPFVFRPFGALLFGYIGDHLGRKATVIITTFLMALSCLVMANLPTYSQIGITATWLITICRIVQGMTSMGEIIGAQIYITETVKRPSQFPAVALLSFLAALGGTFALGISSLVTSFDFNWRLAFWIGSGVAIIGSVARTSLRETPEFVAAKLQTKRNAEESDNNSEIAKDKSIYNEKVNKLTSLAFFLIQCGWPLCFYIAFIHCGHILQHSFGYSPEQVLHQNFIISIVEIIGVLLLMVILSYYLHPLLILKIKLILFAIFILLCPFLLNIISTPFELLLIQAFIMFFVLEDTPAKPIFFDYFPVFKCFTYSAFLYALSRAIMYIITSFGLVFLTKHFGNFGLLIIAIPVVLGYTIGLLHFEKLERKKGNYPTPKPGHNHIVDEIV